MNPSDLWYFLSLVYEKIKLQQATMSKGELQYKQRLEDVR